MAILKHISSKNANYGDAEKYLTFEHDEFTMKPTLDADGRLIPRVDYRISSLNCGGEDFAVACMRSNLRYGKNQKREDVKSHHYIISFDPRDGPDNGLTVDRAHGITKLPASKALQREIEQLTVQKNAGYNDYREKRQRAQELQTVRRNIDQILRGAPSQQKKREQER